MEKREFLDRINALFGGKPLAELSDEQVQWALNLAQYAWDVAMVEAESRGLIGEVDGVPFVQYDLPEGVEEVTHMLRGEWEDGDSPCIPHSRGNAPVQSPIANVIHQFTNQLISGPSDAQMMLEQQRAEDGAHMGADTPKGE